MRYLRRDIDFVSVPLLPFEIANSLICATRQKRIDQDEINIMLDDFLRLDIRLELPNLQETTALAQQHNLTSYDASYLCLALSKGIQLLTLDEQLKKLSPIPF